MVEYVLILIATSFIECLSRVVNTPASYLEVPGSNLGPETGYPDRAFSWFSSVQDTAGIVP
jgi:hypothetical protein